MLAVLIISAVGGALYTIFSNGIQVWHRATVSKPSYDINLFFEQMETDLRNFRSSAAVPFKGQNYSFEFDAFSPSSKFAALTTAHSLPARLRYDFQSTKRTASRIVTDYYGILNQQSKPSSERILLQGINRCSFQYFKRVNELQAPSWHSSWSDPCAPDAVKASVEYFEDGRMRVLTKIISVPAGGCFL